VLRAQLAAWDKVIADYSKERFFAKVIASQKAWVRRMQPYLAANNLGSDYEHARTLLSVVERGDVPQPVVLAVLASAKSISSDHEQSELLLAVINKVKMDDAIRAAVRQNAASIGSQYDRGRVFEALSRD